MAELSSIHILIILIIVTFIIPLQRIVHPHGTQSLVVPAHARSLRQLDRARVNALDSLFELVSDFSVYFFSLQ